MTLQQEIDERRKEIRTDNYSMSIGEWINLYENNEIDIHPEFQRVYRWREEQKTNLIESILLGIPIPPIFVSQRKDGVWDVVDGLQRLSTIYEFVGILKEEDGKLRPPLSLQKAKYLPSLEGKKWSGEAENLNTMTKEQELLIKRSKIDVSIVLRESDDMAKYELFQRLNTGGSTLTQQEVRNCILLMVNPNFYHWLEKLSDDQAFKECVALSDKNIDEKYHMELAIRFLIFNKIDPNDVKSQDVGEFVTEKMVKMASDKDFDYKENEENFKNTFEALRLVLGSNAFRRYSNENWKGGFLMSPYEVIAYGMGYNYPNVPQGNELIKITMNLYTDETYTKHSGSGVRANIRLPQLIPLGRKLFKK